MRINGQVQPFSLGHVHTGRRELSTFEIHSRARLVTTTLFPTSSYSSSILGFITMGSLDVLERFDPRTPTILDKSLEPNCFTLFPVHLHPEENVISEGCDDARRLLERHIGSGFKISRTHSAGPYGNFFALTLPEGDVQKVKILTEVIETLWIYDGKSQSSASGTKEGYN